MKKQTIRLITGLVRLAVFIGCTAMIGANAQTTTTESNPTSNDEYTIEWITPKRPPMPPVRKDGKWVPWEEVYGPLPELPPRPIKRYKNPRAPVDPELRWLGTKHKLAPHLFIDGKPIAEAEKIVLNKEARAAELEKIKPRNVRLKVDGLDARLLAPLTGAKTISRGGPDPADGPTPENADEPRLEIAAIRYFPQADITETELWLIDGPTDEWWTLFSAASLNQTAWTPVWIGAPAVAVGNIQVFYVQAQGQPPESYFQIFKYQDSDYDGLLDGFEIAVFKTDPNNPDSNSTWDADGDGQPDYPGLAGNGIADGDEDFDGDGLSNFYELQLGINPLVAQNSAIDTDSDGLPDWLETLITEWTLDPDPSPLGDSDGDSVNNITEWQMQTDPSWGFDGVFANYGALPDNQRVVEHVHLQVGSTGPSLLSGLSFSNAPEAYFDASFSGYHGTAAHVIVLKDTDADGNYAPGVDTFKWGVAFQSPNGYIPTQSIPTTDPADGPLEDVDILSNVTTILDMVWGAAEVNSKLDTISEASLTAVQQRSFSRKWVRFRQLQLMTVAQPLPQGLVLRTRLKIAQIHTQATILRKATLIVGEEYPGTQALARMGRFVPVAGGICSVLSFQSDASGMVAIYAQYFRDVKRRCDFRNDTALDLAVALSNVLDVAFPAPVNSAFLWPFWWYLLSNFDGWDSSC